MLYELVEEEMCFALGPLVDMAGHVRTIRILINPLIL